ncbi:MAG TPA: hypothetical protein PLB49_08400 [Chitinophagaceae bacterium]|nr:hypothetical protein [Chitinophagaceae bacterium]HPH31857.1 hypothetical protein [Chitinophagaceae bacterium]
MRYIFIALITCCNICSFGQSKNDLRNISDIDSLINANLDLGKMDYVCYSVNDKAVVVSKNKCVYYLSMKQGLLHKKLESELSVDSLFSKNNVRAGKQFCDDDYRTSCIGSYVYLSLNKEGKKLFQFNLPYMLLCGEKKVNYPFEYQALEMLDRLFSSFFAPK